MTQDDLDRMAEMLLNEPYWVIDILPEQVPATGANRFFAFENYYLRQTGSGNPGRRYREILLKLNCYVDFYVRYYDADQYILNPAPEQLASRTGPEQQDMSVLIPTEETLITLYRDDSHMTVYHPTETILNRIRSLASAEGLFVWQPGQPRTEREEEKETEQIMMTPVGRVKNDVIRRKDTSWGEEVSAIVLDKPYAAGLKGLEEFSHAIILFYLDQAHFDRERHLQRRPQNRDDMPQVGIFAQRGKDRPNRIGITAVEILSVSGGTLAVKGLDAVDGTPVLDIKPYYPMYDRKNATVPEWVERLMTHYFS